MERMYSYLDKVKSISLYAILSLSCFFILDSCCPDDEVYYPPEETLRYWDEHDTIVFYSPELDKYEIFPVCIRDYIGAAEVLNGRCGTIKQFYAAQYRIHKNHCDNTEKFICRPQGTKFFTVIRTYSDGKIDNAHNNENNARVPIEIFGHTYKSAYKIDYNSPNDSLSTVFVTLEHGIIQYRFDSITFNLVNDEI